MKRKPRIPPELRRDHILVAMDRLGPDSSTWPPRSASTKYNIIDPRTGMRFPPKLVLSVAVSALPGYDLPRGRISGGPDTNNVLKRLGFDIVPKHPEKPQRAPHVPRA